MKNITLLALLLVAAKSACAGELQNDADSFTLNGHVPGAAVSKGSCKSFEYSVSGVLKKGEVKPVLGSSKFNIGSNSKSMLATAAMVANEKRLLDVMTNTFDGHNATLHHYLTHTGGVPGFDTGDELNSLQNDLTSKQFAQLAIDRASSEQIGHLKYSNAGYVIASKIVESKLEKNWYKAIQEYVFLPLGISASLGDGIGPEDATGHYLNGDQLEVYQAAEPAIPRYLEAAGNIAISIEEYSRYLQDHLCGLTQQQSKLLSYESYEKLHTPFENSTSAMGWGITELSGYKVSFHIGGTGTFISVAAIVPGKDQFLAVLINSGAPLAQKSAVNWIISAISSD